MLIEKFQVCHRCGRSFPLHRKPHDNSWSEAILCPACHYWQLSRLPRYVSLSRISRLTLERIIYIKAHPELSNAALGRHFRITRERVSVLRSYRLEVGGK